MKLNLKDLLLILLAVISASCVQQTKKQKILFSVNTKGEKNVQSIGVRGSIQPFLNWNESTLMLTDHNNDSIYTGEIVLDIPFDFVEVKFIKNEEQMELDGRENRRIYFEKSGTTIYNTQFDEF